jgi:hypothetical protein
VSSKDIGLTGHRSVNLTTVMLPQREPHHGGRMPAAA